MAWFWDTQSIHRITPIPTEWYIVKSHTINFPFTCNRIGSTYLSISIFSLIGVLTINGRPSILGFTFNFLFILNDMNECIQHESKSNKVETFLNRNHTLSKVVTNYISDIHHVQLGLYLLLFLSVWAAPLNIALFPTSKAFWIVLSAFTTMLLVASKANWFLSFGFAYNVHSSSS